MRPSSDANCIAIYRFDCDTPDINLNGPLFSRWDMRLKKSFGLGGRRSFEIMAEVLNVFDTINFNHGGPTSTIQGGTSLNPSPNNGERYVQGDVGLHRHQHHVRSGRPRRPAGLASELVRSGRPPSSDGGRSALHVFALPENLLTRACRRRSDARRDRATTCPCRQARRARRQARSSGRSRSHCARPPSSALRAPADSFHSPRVALLFVRRASPRPAASRRALIGWLRRASPTPLAADRVARLRSDSLARRLFRRLRPPNREPRTRDPFTPDA